MSRPHEPEIAAIRGSLAAFGDPWRVGETPLSRLPERSRRVRLGVPAPATGEIAARADQAERLAAEARGAAGQPVVAATAPASTLPAAFDLRHVNGRDFVTAVRAYDRVLMSGAYLIPLFYAPEDWWALSSRIKHPDKPSLYGAEPTTWWVEQ